ncbi:hypothetical protein NDU88_002267 [Pleurodeles waltl]|uniref:Uncharacterized protein n=1 Tax=Pleurodeles waltl TaxID=8319 RepID=A0AAV7UWH6_PLEWA|nr:hypothetical protein NDU88_002267 [Pleurodeles waltl]
MLGSAAASPRSVRFCPMTGEEQAVAYTILHTAQICERRRRRVDPGDLNYRDLSEGGVQASGVGRGNRRPLSRGGGSARLQAEEESLTDPTSGEEEGSAWALLERAA